jgi:predicted PurR-regulated permease PerM
MSQPNRISFVIFVILMVLVAWLHLGTFLLTALFGYLALQVFTIRRSKPLSVTLYLIAVAVIGAGLVYFSNLAYRTLPRIAEISIPAMVGFAEKNGIELPFTDYASLKTTALEAAREGFGIVGRYASVASFQFVLLVAGLVVPVSIFLGSGWTANSPSPATPGSLYSDVTGELTTRFKTLYASFAKVMGAQMVISAINAVLTAAFLIFNSYPYAGLLTTLVFLCGLIPIVGNIISNAVIVGVGFTLSSRTGVYALVFLVMIHKLEYFLNSKIVGQRIDSPMWLTLIGLLVGERLMGVPGMILAPVFLHFIKIEASTNRSLPGGRTIHIPADRPVEKAAATAIPTP